MFIICLSKDHCLASVANAKDLNPCMITEIKHTCIFPASSVLLVVKWWREL